jgi:hypothetical protein
MENYKLPEHFVAEATSTAQVLGITFEQMEQCTNACIKVYKQIEADAFATLPQGIAELHKLLPDIPVEAKMFFAYKLSEGRHMVYKQNPLQELLNALKR